MSIQKIHPVLITRDAAATIERALTSLREFSEVIVYDNGSTDHTVELCKHFPNTKVVVGEFFGFGRTKNHAADLAAGDWILSLDADEYVDEELLASLRTLALTDLGVAYAVQRRNLFMGKEVKGGGWGHDWLVRVFNRRRCRFTDALVHEKVLVPQGCALVRLRGSLWHYAAMDLDTFLHKISRYSELNRQDGKRTHSVLNIVLRSQWSFFKSYIFQRGFLDGWRGIVIATCTAIGTFFKHMKRYADKAIEAEKRRSSP